MIITRDWLLAHGATPECADLARFDAEWPDGVEVTAESLARAREIGIDTVWWAGCADLTTDVVASLAHDPDEWVREALAGRADLPPEVVASLASDPSEYVREALASRTKETP